VAGWGGVQSKAVNEVVARGPNGGGEVELARLPASRGFLEGGFVVYP
jgi:hypothetical protein